jgi:general secretion pathway protein M
MKHWIDQAWRRQWQQIAPGRRALLTVALWGVTLVVICQWLWLPGQARVQQAERELVREHELSSRVQRIVQGPARSQNVAQRLTPARLNERARLAGLHVASLEAKAGQVDISLDGPAAAVLAWLHELEREGGEVISIHLQVEGERLQARFALTLIEA